MSRLVGQMRFWRDDRLGKVESVPVKKTTYRGRRSVRRARITLRRVCCCNAMDLRGAGWSLSCDRQGLQHAFAEIILNALQAERLSPNSQVQVRTRI